MSRPFDWTALEACRQQLAAGEAAAAVERLRQLRQEYPEPAIATVLADALFQQGHSEAALACLQADIDQGVDNHWTHYSLGSLLARLGRVEAAAAAFRQSHAHQGWFQSLERGYTLSHDYFSGRIPQWQQFFEEVILQAPIRILEIGSWQGGSSLWLLDHVLGPRGGVLHCVDTWGGSSEHGFLAELGITIEELFDANIARNPHGALVEKKKGPSEEVLPGLEPHSYDLIYIDGAHEASYAIQDAVHAHRLVRPGGFLLFDDYHFQFADPSQNTARAIDFFVETFHASYSVVHKGAQVLLQRLVPSASPQQLAAAQAPEAATVQQSWKKLQGWTHLRRRISDALLQGDWQGAAALISGEEEVPYCQPPEGVSREIWTELLLNGCAASEAKLPSLQLVESRSLPRSGHHYLRRLLEQACGEQFSYCEGYQEPGCCKSNPCSVAAYWRYAREHGQPHLRLLKSHDFALTDATFTPPPAMVRLIQVRKPLELLASWLELEQLSFNRELLQSSSIALERVFLYHEAEVLEDAWRVIDELGTVMTAEQAQAWLADKVSYVQAFLRKWLPQARPFPFGGQVSGGTYLLRYNDLEHSVPILQALGLRGDQERPLPVFATQHPDVTVRRSTRVTTLIQAQLGSLEQADQEAQGQLPALADGSSVEL